MLIINKIDDENLKKIPARLCLTIGMFDGFHLGHKSLIEKAIESAKATGTYSGIFTFANHPLAILAPAYAPPSILTPEEKTDTASLFGVDVFCQIPFTKEIANLSPESFVAEFLVKRLKVSSINVGFNFGFGKNGRGKPETLVSLGEKYGFKVDVMPPVFYQDKIVSSTWIRELIESGEVGEAMKFLGRPHSVRGRVVTGFGRGRELGFPTANLRLEPAKVNPGRGVYAVLIKTGNEILMGMLNIGHNPTFNGKDIYIEANIFGFDKDIVGEDIRVFFISRLRIEEKFSRISELVVQLEKDRKKSLETLQSLPREIIELCKKIKI